MKRLLIFTTLLFLAAASGCANSGKNFTNDLYPDEKGPAGYHEASGKGIIENEFYRVSVRQIKPNEAAGQPDILKDLIRKEYVLIRMEIINLSDKKIIFNPVYAVLTTDAFDYKKPLDYTDIYDMVGDKENRNTEMKARAVKGLFYDLALTLPPGVMASKILIFPPLSKDTEKADLVIKELYVGTDVVGLSFPFVTKVDY